MFTNDYTAKLLSLEDVIITDVEKISNQLHIYLELPRVSHICPQLELTWDLSKSEQKVNKIFEF